LAEALMVAYSYKGRFVAPIRIGLGLPVLSLHREFGGYHPEQPIKPKRQTIRAFGRRRHARSGETIQHYHGMRSPKCFKIGDARCTTALPIKLYVRSGKIELVEDDGLWWGITSSRDLDSFAQADGFDDWAQMRAFWIEEHDGKQLGPFHGVLIRCMPL